MRYEVHKTYSWKTEPNKQMMDNCFAFRDIVNLYKASVGFYFPNYRDAPWQVQAEIGGEKVNFWPHKLKAHVEYRGGGAVEGRYEIINLINDQIAKDVAENSRTSDGWVLDDDWDVFE